MTSALSVYLVDDVEALRELTRFGLQEDPGFEVVGDASNPVIGIPEIERLRPDAVLLDLSMPEMDGLEAIPHIRSRSPESAIVIFTGFTESRMARDVIRLGAHGFLPKGTPIDEIRATLRGVVARMRNGASHVDGEEAQP